MLKYISPRDEIKLPGLELPNINELKQQQLKQQQQTLIQSAITSTRSKLGKIKQKRMQRKCLL